MELQMCLVLRRRKQISICLYFKLTLCFIQKKVHVLKNFQKKIRQNHRGGKRLPQDKLKRHFLKTLFCE